MPKILGLSLVGVLVASVLFFLVGWLWYGILFMEQWMAASGITAEEAESGNPIWMLGGFAITVLQVIGIGLAMKWKGAAGIGGAVTTGLTLWVFFAFPFTSYAYLYGGNNLELLLIDGSHLLVGWLVSAVVLALIK